MLKAHTLVAQTLFPTRGVNESRCSRATCDKVRSKLDSSSIQYPLTLHIIFYDSQKGMQTMHLCSKKHDYFKKLRLLSISSQEPETISNLNLKQ